MRALAILLLATAPAAAQVADETPKPTIVRGKLDGVMARLVARYSIAIPRTALLQDGVSLVYPTGGVITGAVATVGGRPHRLDLVGAETAQQKFEDVVASDASTPRG